MVQAEDTRLLQGFMTDIKRRAWKWQHVEMVNKTQTATKVTEFYGDVPSGDLHVFAVVPRPCRSTVSGVVPSRRLRSRRS